MFTEQQPKNFKKLLRRGFTLVELLTVIAIIGILAAIIIPTVGRVMDKARKSVAASNLRQIGQAYTIYASSGSRPRTIDAADLDAYAAILAKEAGLNDPKIWILGEDPLVEATSGVFPTAVAKPGATSTEAWTPTVQFVAFPKSFSVVNLVPSRAPSTTPIAFTRGITANDSTWSAADGVYGDEGGFIVFKDGHIEFFEALVDEEGNGLLINYITKAPAKTLGEALPPAPASILTSE